MKRSPVQVLMDIPLRVDGDKTELLDSLVPILQANEKRAFLTERTPGGSPWKPLSKAWIRKKGFSKILVLTGRLYESLVTPNGTVDTIWETSESQAYLMFGTSVEYAAWHQTGREEARGSRGGYSRVPARPFVGVDQQASDELVNAVADAAVKRILKE